MCTPFASDGAVDPDAQRRVVRYAIDNGADGIVAFGLAGEVSKLTVPERKLLTDVILDEVGGRVPTVLGVSDPNVETAVELARYAERRGASCVSVAPASFTLAPDLVEQTARVASAVSIPVMIQDAAHYLGAGLTTASVSEIVRRAPNVGHLKIEAGSERIVEWLGALGKDFPVWCGCAGMYQLDALRVGGVGIIPGCDVVECLVAVHDAETSGEVAFAESVFGQILPLLIFQSQSLDHYNACAKRVLMRRGVLNSPSLRGPTEQFHDVSVKLLDHYLDGLETTEGLLKHIRTGASTTPAQSG